MKLLDANLAKNSRGDRKIINSFDQEMYFFISWRLGEHINGIKKEYEP